MNGKRTRAHAGVLKSRLRARILWLSALLWLAGTAAADPASQGVTGRCEIQFSGSSTLHGFSGEVRSQPFELEPHIDPSDGSAWWSGSVTVPVAEMDTGIARRDRKMHAMFEADRFPLIVADLSQVESALLAAARGGGEPNLDFDLTIREAKHRVAAKITQWTEQGRGASFDLEFEVSLESFGLEVPPVLGLLRVADRVRVRVHVILDELAEPQRKAAAFDELAEPQRKAAAFDELGAQPLEAAAFDGLPGWLASDS